MAKAAAESRPVELFGERGRELGGILLFGFTAFLLISMASFVETDGGAAGGGSSN